MAINVNCNVTDIFYRYKMPKLITKVEGKGNGIKTVIVNMTDIGKAISRPATYPTKFFGCELGAQTQFDVKNERYIVNGDHHCSRLQELLHTFIKKFVLCSECENPETNMIVKEKKGLISLRCIACGFSTNVDMRHKLTTFIIKNPPNSETTHGATPSKKEKKTSKKDKDRSSPEANKDQDEDPMIEAPPVNNKHKDDDDDDDWGDLDVEAEKKRRMEELSAGAAKLVMEDDMEKSAAERLEIFYNFLKTKKDSSNLSGADKTIVGEAERLEVKDKATMVLAEILLSENVLKEVKVYRSIFLRFTHENLKAQKYLIGGLEQLIGNLYKDALMPKVANIFKLFYDLDIIEEEVLLEWDKKVSKKYVSKDVAQEIHNKASPFINWLREAEEEEDDSEDEEDDDIEIEYKEGVTKIESQNVTPASKPSAATNGAPEEEEDDLDIDDI